MTNNSVSAAVESRTSTVLYDTGFTVPDATLEELVRLATLSPSAYNFQNWKFIVVRSAQGKHKLQAAAYGQRQIAEASATFVACGTLRAHEHLASVLAPDWTPGGCRPGCGTGGWRTQPARMLAMASCSAMRPSGLHPWPR